MKIRSLLTGGIAAMALLIGQTGTASAVDKNGSCESTELCLYWSNTSSAFIDFELGDNDHRNDRYICCSGRLGYNEIVADNAATAWNRNDYYAVVASLLACEGAFDVIVPGETTLLNDSVRNKNWSNCWEF